MPAEEKSPRFAAHEVLRDARGARRLADDHDPLRITAEGGDILLHPAQRRRWSRMP